MSRFINDLGLALQLNDLVVNIKQHLKNLFQCKQVNILLHFDGICKLFREEGKVPLKKFHFVHEDFYVPITSKRDREYFGKLKPQVDQRRIKAGTISPDEINWPVLCSDTLSTRKHIYMIINILGYDHNNFRSSDGLLLNIYAV